jgi:hypothetical protein
VPNAICDYLPMVGSAASKSEKSATSTAFRQKEEPQDPIVSSPQTEESGLVVLSGKYLYLGKYGTPKSLAEYHRLIQEWLVNQ